MADPIIVLEEKLAHTTRMCEDLSDVVATQAKQIDLLEKRVAALLDMARDQTVEAGSVTFNDAPPPHW